MRWLRRMFSRREISEDRAALPSAIQTTNSAARSRTTDLLAPVSISPLLPRPRVLGFLGMFWADMGVAEAPGGGGSGVAMEMPDWDSPARRISTRLPKPPWIAFRRRCSDTMCVALTGLAAFFAGRRVGSVSPEGGGSWGPVASDGKTGEGCCSSGGGGGAGCG